MFKFIKSALGKNTYTKNTPIKSKSSERIDLINTMTYGSNYTKISEYDATIAHYLASKEVPKYYIDWLADSIKNGEKIEFTAISFSIEKELPYLCCNEEETWMFTSQENPLQDSTEGIYRVLLGYKFGSNANENKMNYWLNRLLALAKSGNIMAQALICWRCGVIGADGKYDSVLPQNIWKDLKIKYEDSILKHCNAGDPYAQLAVAKYSRNISENEQEKLYLAAIEKGLSDACYYYAKFLDQKRFIANNMAVNIPPYGTAEWQEYMRDELSLYKKGAELNNGILAGYCQFRLGNMYENGDGGVFKDAATAQMWFKKAYNNGYENAKSYIN